MSSVSHPDTLLLVGTRRGLFRFRSDADRTAWHCDDIQIAGHEIYHAKVHPRTGVGYAAARHPVWGTHVYRFCSDLDSM